MQIPDGKKTLEITANNLSDFNAICKIVKFIKKAKFNTSKRDLKITIECADFNPKSIINWCNSINASYRFI